jgi:hypothetical protein
MFFLPLRQGCPSRRTSSSVLTCTFRFQKNFPPASREDCVSIFPFANSRWLKFSVACFIRVVIAVLSQCRHPNKKIYLSRGHSSPDLNAAPISVGPGSPLVSVFRPAEHSFHCLAASVGAWFNFCLFRPTLPTYFYQWSCYLIGVRRNRSVLRDSILFLCFKWLNFIAFDPSSRWCHWVFWFRFRRSAWFL